MSPDYCLDRRAKFRKAPRSPLCTVGYAIGMLVMFTRERRAARVRAARAKHGRARCPSRGDDPGFRPTFGIYQDGMPVPVLIAGIVSRWAG